MAWTVKKHTGRTRVRVAALGHYTLPNTWFAIMLRVRAIALSVSELSSPSTSLITRAQVIPWAPSAINCDNIKNKLIVQIEVIFLPPILPPLLPASLPLPLLPSVHPSLFSPSTPFLFYYNYTWARSVVAGSRYRGDPNAVLAAVCRRGIITAASTSLDSPFATHWACAPCIPRAPLTINCGKHSK